MIENSIFADSLKQASMQKDSRNEKEITGL